MVLFGEEYGDFRLCYGLSFLRKFKVVIFLLGNSLASEFYTPTFRNTLFLTMKMEQTECFETSAYKIQTPGNYPEENIQHTEHEESLKSRNLSLFSEDFKIFSHREFNPFVFRLVTRGKILVVSPWRG